MQMSKTWLEKKQKERINRNKSFFKKWYLEYNGNIQHMMKKWKSGTEAKLKRQLPTYSKTARL